MHEQQAIQQGFAAYKKGDYAAAKALLSSVRHPQGLHLLGIVEKNLGNHSNAARLLVRAAKGDPKNHEIVNNLGLVYRLMQCLPEALSSFREALELAPDFRPARLNLGKTLTDLGQPDMALKVLVPLASEVTSDSRILCAVGQAYVAERKWQEAEAAFSHALDIEPDHPPSRLGYASMQLEVGFAEEAMTRLEALIRDGVDQGAVRFMRGRTHMQLGNISQALADFRAAHTADPTPLTLKMLAGILWMCEDKVGFNALVQESTGKPDLAISAIALCKESGELEAALDALNALPAERRNSLEALSLAAQLLIDLEQPEQALQRARAALALSSHDEAATMALVTACLMLGDGGKAMEHIRPMRTRKPDDQHWIAFEMSALRVNGAPQYQELADMDRFVRAYRLPVPQGFDTLERFNDEFLAALDRVNVFRTHPLDQSLREGAQTPRELSDIPDPAIQAYIKALDEPIRQYMRDIGGAPDHLLTARNSGNYRMTGCWSVRLGSGGWHINHVHPEGWISSAYYVSVPEGTRNNKDKAGWIKFGEPPFPTKPPSPPEKWICPEAGTLVLFPSFMWHGTQPIHDGTTRVTAPFDLVPA